MEPHNQLPKNCTVSEIAKFFRLTHKNVYKKLSKARIPILTTIPSPVGGPPLRIFDSEDVMDVFVMDVKKYRNYDCELYSACLDKAARGPNRDKKIGMNCNMCRKFGIK